MQNILTFADGLRRTLVKGSGMIRFDPGAFRKSVILALLWVSAFTFIVAPVSNGIWWPAWVNTVIIAIVVPVTVTYVHRRRPPWKVLDPRKQSWAFMFGDPICLAPALAVTAAAWGKGLVPAFAYSFWWQFTMLAVGLLAGLVLCTVDARRYAQNDALDALDLPDKIVHDRVVVPALFSALLVTAAPLLFQWTIYTTGVVLLIAGWAALIVIDDKLRFVDPRWQYDLSPR